jgi:hypothetical protein
MKRMYYLTDNLDSTEQISVDMRQQGITRWRFHVLSKDEAGLYERRIHSANYFQQLDIIRIGERGAIIGFVVATLIAIFVLNLKPFGSSPSALTFVAIFGFFTMFGAWVGGLAGIASENQKIAQYRGELEAGKYLIMIDVRKSEEEKVKALMEQKYPQARLMRIDSTFVNPFKFASA